MMTKTRPLSHTKHEDLIRWILHHEFWLVDNAITTKEAAELARADLHTTVTRQQLALLAGRICMLWPKLCRKALRPKPVALSAVQWERLIRAIEKQRDQHHPTAARYAAALRHRWGVYAVDQGLRARSIILPIRSIKPTYPRASDGII